MKISLLLLFWGLWFVNFSTRTIISPLLPVIEGELAISHALAGSIFSFLSLGYTITLLLSGLLSPRIGYKRSIIVGFAICMVALFCLRYATTYFSVVTVTLFIGLGAGIYLPSAIPLLTATFGRESWGKAIAFHDTAPSLSVFSIPILTAFALRALHWRELFLILSAACLIAVIVFWAFSPDPHPPEEKRAQLSDILARRDFWIMATLWIFGASNSLGLYNVIPLFIVEEKGMDLEMANTIFGLSRVGGILVVVTAGFLVDRYGVKKILFPVFLATGLSTMGLAIVQGVALLVTMLILQATVSALFFPAALVAISKLTSFNERSIFTGGSVAIGVLFGAGLTPLIVGAVADLWSFQSGILLLGVITTFSCAVLRNLQRI
jgi:NNP family nitrate/nitrite transporter-like MFS transporter